MRELIEAHARGLGIPGVAVGVLDHGEATVYCEGVTSVEHPLPITDTTIFQMGSISKTFVGTAAMVLVDQGRLELDTPIVAYVPDLRLSSDELTRRVTMRHLLTHTAGWVGDYFGDTGMGDDALARFVVKLAKAPQLTPLGTVYSYNNTGFNLAAHVVATIVGRTYERAVREMILGPLGMNRTAFTAEEVMTERVAVGHRDGVPQRWARTRAYSGAGGVLSCAADMLTFARFNLGDGSPIMSADALAQMQQPSLAAGSLSDWLGLVWRVDDHAGLRIVHHGGTTNGYMTELRLAPARDLAWVILTNGDHNHQLDPLVQEALLGPDTPLVAHQPADLASYLGQYDAVLAHLQTRRTDDDLVLDVTTMEWGGRRPPQPTRLVFRDADRFIAADAPFRGWKGEFVRGGSGEIEWLRWDGRIHRRG